MLTEQVELLKAEFLCTAEWRREKATEYPDDERNLKAAEILEHLAGTVDQIEPAVLQTYEFAGNWEEVEVKADVHNEMIRTIGFHWTPSTATEFITEFRLRLGRLKERAMRCLT